MDVWSAGRLGGLTLPNRFVHTAVGEGMCLDDGSATTRLRDRYALLGRGGAIGLIVTGHSYVAKSGQMRKGQTGIHSDRMIGGLARVAAAAQRDGSSIFLQISHGGLASGRELTGQEALSPGNSPRVPQGHAARVMLTPDMEEVAGQFADAAWRAREAGFDGVQVHMAHGFLCSQFLSPYYNRRDDEYGGSAAGRAAFPAMVVRAIREKVGRAYPVAAKMNGMDFVPGGMSLAESIEAAGILEAAGLDGVELSGGICIADIPGATPFRPVHPVTLQGACYFAHLAAAHKKALNIAVTAVGGIRSQAAANTILDQGGADLIGICRPLIREPDLLLRWREGRDDPPNCLSCNRCLESSRGGMGVHCPVGL